MLLPKFRQQCKVGGRQLSDLTAELQKTRVQRFWSAVRLTGGFPPGKHRSAALVALLLVRRFTQLAEAAPTLGNAQETSPQEPPTLKM